MSKKNIITAIIIIAIIAVLSYFIFSSTKSEQSNNDNFVSQDETLHTTNFDVNIDDVYYADYFYDEKSNFDKYVATDVKITNTTEENQHINTLTTFKMADKYTDYEENKAHQPVIDENKKKFGATLAPQETFEITLVFAVDESDSYKLYFNESAKTKDEYVQGFLIDGNITETKKVEETVEHNYPDLESNEHSSENEHSNENEDSKENIEEETNEENEVTVEVGDSNE